jgi:hypothetical protein
MKMDVMTKSKDGKQSTMMTGARPVPDSVSNAPLQKPRSQNTSMIDTKSLTESFAITTINLQSANASKKK